MPLSTAEKQQRRRKRLAYSEHVTVGIVMTARERAKLKAEAAQEGQTLQDWAKRALLKSCWH